jgi:hypothetical protein
MPGLGWIPEAATTFGGGKGKLAGQSKYLGGEKGLNGAIYGCPGDAEQVLKIIPETGETSLIGPKFPGKFKWLRGARGPDGCIYGIPLHSDTVLKIDPATDEVTTLGGPFIEAEKGAERGELYGTSDLHYSGGATFKWHGGVVAKDGCIYGIPANAETVIKIDCRAGKVTTFGGPLPGKNKWYGGLLGEDGCIYGIPQCANTVLKINPVTQEVTLLGNLDSGGWKWHGGVVGSDGNIYGIPSNADSVLKIVPSTGEVSTIGDVRGVTPHREDGKYKWLGGVLGSDGAIYGMPGDADVVLKIMPYTDEVSLIGTLPIIIVTFHNVHTQYPHRYIPSVIASYHNSLIDTFHT